MPLTLEVQETIFQELQIMPHGKTIDLKSNLEKKGVSSNEFDEVWKMFCLVGIIRHGQDGLKDLRYMFTDFGRRYSKPILSFRKTQTDLIRLEKKLAPGRS